MALLTSDPRAFFLIIGIFLVIGSSYSEEKEN